MGAEETGEKQRKESKHLGREEEEASTHFQEAKCESRQDQSRRGRGEEPILWLDLGPQTKGAAPHSGAKVRTNREKPKISRKDLRKREEERKNPKLKQKRKNADILKENLEPINGPPDPKKAKKEKKKAKKVSAEALKEKESEKKFASLVGQYKSTLQNNSEVRKSGSNEIEAGVEIFQFFR